MAVAAIANAATSVLIDLTNIPREQPSQKQRQRQRGI